MGVQAVTRWCSGCGTTLAGVTHVCPPPTGGTLLRRPYEELHAENQRLVDALQAALTQINALLERERQTEEELGRLRDRLDAIHKRSPWIT
jgi:hypothetical protein